MVSHDEEFCGRVAKEFWRMTGPDPGPAGHLKREGELAENAGPEVNLCILLFPRNDSKNIAPLGSASLVLYNKM